MRAPSSSLIFSVPPQLMRTIDRFCGERKKGMMRRSVSVQSSRRTAHALCAYSCCCGCCAREGGRTFCFCFFEKAIKAPLVHNARGRPRRVRRKNDRVKTDYSRACDSRKWNTQHVGRSIKKKNGERTLSSLGICSPYFCSCSYPDTGYTEKGRLSDRNIAFRIL